MKTTPTPDGLALTVSIFASLPDDGRCRLPAVTALFGCSPATVWRRVKDGRLPAPRKDGRMTYWTAGDLRQALRG